MTTRTRRKRAIMNQLTPTETAYLADIDPPESEGIDSYALFCFRHGSEAWETHPRDLWQKHGKEFLKKFIESNPGRRPLAWWQFAAPRWDTGSGGFWEPLPILRQRLGGTGTPKHEVLAYVPHYHKGIPAYWIDETDMRIYAKSFAGRDVQAYDPADPPTFESEATYLERHDLLTAAEKKWIKKHPEALEPETVTLDEGN